MTSQAAKLSPEGENEVRGKGRDSLENFSKLQLALDYKE